MEPMITLRKLTMEDAAITWTWRNQPAVMDFFSGHPFHVTYEDEIRWMQQQVRPDAPGRTYGVVEKSSGRLVGMTFLKNIQPHFRSAEFAILIDSAHAGKGLGKAACAATLYIAFHELELHRVWLKVRVDNPAAIRIYESCGMTIEGTLRDDVFKQGRFVDQYLMAILENEFHDR